MPDPIGDRLAKLDDVAWTPGRRDLPSLVQLVESDEDERVAASALKALLRAGEPALTALLRRAEQARASSRPRLIRAAGRFLGGAHDETIRCFLLARLDDEDVRSRRQAVRVLGHLRGTATERREVEARLLQAWEREPGLPERRVVAAALGKLGGERSLTLLRAVAAGGAEGDAELRRIVGEALVRLSGGAHVEPGCVDASAQSDRPLDVALRCRAGIESILVEECPPSWRARALRPGWVSARLTGPLSSLFAARTALGFGFPLAPLRPAQGENSVDAAVRGLTAPEAAAIVSAFTVGVARYRIEWTGGRHRASTLRLAERLSSLRPEWVNDARLGEGEARRSWVFVVAEQGGEVGVELRPCLDDPRFSWRVRDVPAASHPTLAAALARVGGARPGDVVWDPFVGSGGELCERARLGSYRSLHGGDLDERALDAARANLAAAGAERTFLSRRAALDPAPPGCTLILTNPPMGRRVHRSGDLGELLDRFIAHAASSLAPGGRLVWFAPRPERAASRATACGLRIERRHLVDLGGYTAELQAFAKPRPSK